MTDDDADRWLVTTRRRSALRVLGLGIPLAVVGGILFYLTLGTELSEQSLTRKAVAGAAAAVGAALSIAGGLMLARVRRGPRP